MIVGVRHLRLCRVFLNEERRAEVKSMSGCFESLKKIVDRHHHYTTQLNIVSLCVFVCVCITIEIKPL